MMAILVLLVPAHLKKCDTDPDKAPAETTIARIPEAIVKAFDIPPAKAPISPSISYQLSAMRPSKTLVKTAPVRVKALDIAPAKMTPNRDPAKTPDTGHA